MIERWEDAMLRLNELALPPEFALAFCSDAIQPSHVVGGPDSQRYVRSADQALRGKFWER